MRNQRYPRILAVAVLGAAGACASAPRPAALTPSEPAVVIFENQSPYQAAVYAIARGGARVRVGTVQSGRTDTLTLRSSVAGAGGVTLVARLLAVSRVPSTGLITLLPGDRILVTLPSQANILSVLPAGS